MFRRFIKRVVEFSREHWKLMAALLLGAAAAITVGILVAVFPPALAFIAGLSLFGFAPFAALLTMAPVAAAFAAAGIAAAATFVAAAAFNLVTGISNWLDKSIRRQEPATSYARVDENDESSTSKATRGLDDGKGKTCCASWNPFNYCKDSRDGFTASGRGRSHTGDKSAVTTADSQATYTSVQ